MKSLPMKPRLLTHLYRDILHKEGKLGAESALSLAVLFYKARILSPPIMKRLAASIVVNDLSGVAHKDLCETAMVFSAAGWSDRELYLSIAEAVKDSMSLFTDQQRRGLAWALDRVSTSTASRRLPIKAIQQSDSTVDTAPASRRISFPAGQTTFGYVRDKNRRSRPQSSPMFSQAMIDELGLAFDALGLHFPAHDDKSYALNNNNVENDTQVMFTKEEVEKLVFAFDKLSLTALLIPAEDKSTAETCASFPVHNNAKN